MEDTDVEVKDLVCPYPECGQAFNDPRRYEYHLDSCGKNPAKATSTVFTVNRKPPENAPKTPAAKPKEPTPISKASTSAVSQNDKMRLERTNQWTKFILNDANPFLFSAVSNYAGIPAEWADTVIFEGMGPDGKVIKLWDPSLRTRLTFSEGEAKRLAEAAARFSVSPMGQAIGLWIESNAGILALALAGFAAAKYGWRVMQTRTEVAQVKDMLQKQMEMIQTQANMAGAVHDRPTENVA